MRAGHHTDRFTFRMTICIRFVRMVSMAKRKNLVAKARMRLDLADIQGQVNATLMSQLGTVYCAGTPTFDPEQEVWTVPILYATPGFVAGQVGAAQVDAYTGEILSLTETEQLRRQGRKLGRKYRAEIEAAFSHARRS